MKFEKGKKYRLVKNHKEDVYLFIDWKIGDILECVESSSESGHFNVSDNNTERNWILDEEYSADSFEPVEADTSDEEVKVEDEPITTHKVKDGVVTVPFPITKGQAIGVDKLIELSKHYSADDLVNLRKEGIL